MPPVVAERLRRARATSAQRCPDARSVFWG